MQTGDVSRATYDLGVNRIAIIMALAAEAAPVIAELGAIPVAGTSPLPFQFFEATRSGCHIVVSVNGQHPRHGVCSIGTDAASLNTYVTIDRFKPDLVISAGTAGAWARNGSQIGDVYVSDDRFVFHDRRIALDSFSEYGVGSYPAAKARRLAEALGLKTGVVTTSNSLDENDDDRAMIARSHACVKDMEAAAVAYVGEMMDTPVIALKAITDLVDHETPTAEQFTANLALASRLVSEKLLAVIDFCAARSLADLA